MKHTLFAGLAVLLVGLSVQAKDQKDFHGMLLFGETKAYISHLPMYHRHHNYQGIWEVTFEDGGGEPVDTYFQDKAKHPKSYYTIAPNELFVLPDLVSKKTSFGAKLFRNHFERPGRQLLEEKVTVKLQKLIHFHEFKPNQLKADQLEYFLVGSGTDWYAIHLITTAPNFDQVLKVKTQAGYKSGEYLQVPNKMPNVPLEQYSGPVLLEISGVQEPSQLEVEQVLYTEINELKGHSH